VNQLDAVRAMGLLLRDRELRLRFENDRKAIIKELNIAPGQRSYVFGLDLRQLDAQAESLIRKRRAEVAHLVPKTWFRLGSEAHLQFRQYVDHSPWPEGHRRHLVDASMFCQFLRNNTASEYLRSEHHWVSFLANDRSFSVRLLDDLVVLGRERWAVQFCVRWNGVATSKVFRIRSFRELIRR
jgi:hypothetical protein